MKNKQIFEQIEKEFLDSFTEHGLEAWTDVLARLLPERQNVKSIEGTLAALVQGTQESPRTRVINAVKLGLRELPPPVHTPTRGKQNQTRVETDLLPSRQVRLELLRQLTYFVQDHKVGGTVDQRSIKATLGFIDIELPVEEFLTTAMSRTVRECRLDPV